MANISINSRENVIEFIGRNHATRLDIVKNPKTGKMFFSLDNKEATKGAVSKSLQEDIASGKKLSLSEVTVGETVMEGQSTPVYLLMKRGESNTLQSFAL